MENIDLFNNENCALFISLVRPIGEIKLVSNSVSTLLNY